MLPTPPKLEARDLLRREWNAANTVLANDPRIHTGWFDWNNPVPQVTVTNRSEFVIEGGDTGVTAGTGNDGDVQKRAGTFLVNGWSGSRDALEGKGDSGTSPNQKQVAYDLAKEAHRIGVQFEPSQFHSFTISDIQDIPETEESETVFREQCTGQYTYVQHPADL